MSDKASNQDADSFNVKIDWDEPRTGAHTNDLSEDFTCKASLAFDQWFACLTVGKQISNYYRYGEKRGCGKHWSKLRLCMSMKMRSEESGKPNVLDVWTLRTSDKSTSGEGEGGKTTAF
ncbi:hypothetical protein GGI07_004781 [Coemansia sp. Benny D115]|nr:hypothetical protein GGI07_004781 [Coemansia sp. Benny D115]